MEYIEKVETIDAGGGCMVDLIYLKDGRVIGLNDECAVLYARPGDFWQPPPDIKYQTIELAGRHAYTTSRMYEIEWGAGYDCAGETQTITDPREIEGMTEHDLDMVDALAVHGECTLGGPTDEIFVRRLA